MYCDACGAQLESEMKFCRGCGKEVSTATGATGAEPASQERRVASHLRLLMVLWMTQGAYRLIWSMVPGLLSGFQLECTPECRSVRVVCSNSSAR